MDTNNANSTQTKGASARFAKKSTSSATQFTSTSAVPLGRSGQPKRLAALASKDRLKMMENFNPDTSNREKKKLERKLKSKSIPGTLYDSSGLHISSGINLCDCLELTCPGCYLPCKKCSSTKCGPECRAHRKFSFESVEFHGFNHVKKNPLDK